MLCEFCREADWDALTDDPYAGTKHHQSFADLVLSAEGGCDLCQAICAEEERARKLFIRKVDTGTQDDADYMEL